MQIKKFDVFDFFRGVAIFLVIINHIPYHNFIYDNNFGILQKNFFLFGTYGVQLFYLISAITLFKSMKERNENTFIPFFLRRFFRVAPLFYLGILIHTVYFSTIFEERLTIENILKNIFFLNNLVPPAQDLILGGQTIATEMNFYLLLPLLFLFLTSYKKTLLFLFFYLFFLIIINHYSPLIFEEKSFGDINFYRTIYVQLFIFLFGINLYYVLYESNKIKNFNSKKLNLNIKKIIPYIFIFLIILSLGKKVPEYFYFRNMFIVTNIFFFIIIFSITFNHILSKIFFYNFFVKLGRVSFSAYIFHWIVIDIVKKIFFFYEIKHFYLIFFVLIALFLTYLVSKFFYKIEIFFINIGKNYNDKKM